MSKLLKVAMIGCGGNGRGHVKALAGHSEVELVALVDPSKKMLDITRRQIPAVADAPAWADYRKMLKAVELDAVAISTPHTQHTRQIIDCLNAGLHVLCEKPLACSMADTGKIIAKARATRRAVVVAFQRRLAAMQQFMRAFIRDKSFGKPLFVQSFLSQGWLQATKGTWRQVPSLSGGGQLNDSGAHIIDMIFWMMPSRPVEVCALIENRGAKVDIDSAISYRFANGALGNISIIGSGPRNVFWEDMTVTGTAGKGLYLRNGRLTITTGTEMMEVTSFGRGEDCNAHFVDVVRGRVKNASPPEEFLPTIAFTQACWKSASLGGKPVKITY